MLISSGWMLPSLYLQDVWATCIHPDDHKAFFDSLSIELFRAPGHQSEFTKIYKVRRLRGAFISISTTTVATLVPVASVSVSSVAVGSVIER